MNVPVGGTVPNKLVSKKFSSLLLLNTALHSSFPTCVSWIPLIGLTRPLCRATDFIVGSSNSAFLSSISVICPKE
jgi:hypothetical protein